MQFVFIGLGGDAGVRTVGATTIVRVGSRPKVKESKVRFIPLKMPIKPLASGSKRTVGVAGKRLPISRKLPTLMKVQVPSALLLPIKRGQTLDLAQNEQNLRIILRNSNASPIQRRDYYGYGCAVCPKTVPSAGELKKHFLEEHSNPAMLKNLSGQLVKKVVKLDITGLNCNLCKKDLSRLEDFMEHLKTEHKKAVYTDVRNLLLPFKFDVEEYRCAVCSVQHATFKLLQEHMHAHYRNYICEICAQGFVSEHSLASHVNRHGTGEFKCDQCDKCFINEIKRREHIRRTHLGKNKMNKCKFCEERFVDYWKKMNHMVTEHGVPPLELPCHACERTFKNQRALARHTRKDHLMEKKHQCTECEMKFFSKSSLMKHMTKHTGAKEFKCDVCFKAYGRKNTLREHMRIHADDRRFACDFCGQAFVQKCSWRGHMRSKHGVAV